MIRVQNAKPGTFVWVAYGRGPKAVVIERLDLRKNRSQLDWLMGRVRGIYYKVKILENQSVWPKGKTLTLRAMTLSSVKHS